MTETREGTDVVERHYEDGDAVVQKLGFIECLEDGEPYEVKGVLLTFPVGPPDLKLSTAWDGTPFRLVPSDELTRLRAENEALKEALRTISLMSKEHEHDLFSATQVARAALKETDNG